MKALHVAVFAVGILVMSTVSASADTFWEGNVSTDWSDPANWAGGTLPSTPGSGNTVINPGTVGVIPEVTTAGNTTNNELFLSINAGLKVLTGGELTTNSSLITGIWGNSAPLEVDGGTLTILNLLNMGAGGFDGDVVISDGSLSTFGLSINNTGGASLTVTGGGSFSALISQLGNINFWIGNGDILAGPGESLVVDTTTDPNRVIITAIPEPASLALLGAGGLLTVIRRR